MSKNLRNLSARKGLQRNLFETIQSTPDTSEEAIASEFLIGPSAVLGARSFYDFLRDENKGKKVFVCNGTACLTSGKQAKVKKELSKHFEDHEIGHVSCLGHCHTHGAFLYDGQTYSWDDSQVWDDLIHQSKSNKSYEVYTLTDHPILTKPIGALAEFYQLLETKEASVILEEVTSSQLRGRGGAGFPLGFKLSACAETPNEEKYIVCNADEGDPGAFSDMYLLEQNPHLVLFGMMAAGKAVGAKMGVFYIRTEYPDSISKVEQAISDLRDQHIIGEDFDFKIIEGAGAYVCGEETALLNSIEGLRPEVRVRPPFPAQEGLYGKPTVLSNVETFANLHEILQQGGDTFASIGAEKSKGTKLVSLDGFFVKPGIYEVDMGYSFSELVDHAGGFKTDIKAVQVGGPLGGVLPVKKIQDLSIDFESFSDAGLLLGHASVVCIPQDFPMIDYIKHLFEFTRDESCGKCYPCRLGSARGFEMVERAVDDERKIDKALLDDLLETMQLGSLCALGGGLPLPIKNILTSFEAELTQYFQ
jgi:NADH-quinone oxidoreductase subunit F